MTEYTVKEYARRERVTERTVYNWMDKGAIEYRRTPGGGIRILERQSGSRVSFFSLKSSEVPGNPST